MIERPRRPRRWQRVGELSLAVVALQGRSPLVKQLPVALLFALSLAMTVVLPAVSVSSGAALIVAIVAMAAVTLFAAVLPRLDPAGRLVLLVPALDFLIIGVFRFATGQSLSIFASLVILPMVWMAFSSQRFTVIYAFTGVCAVFLVPFGLGASVADLPAELGRSFFAAVTFGLAAAVISDLARLSRRHIEDLRARERSTMAELERASEVQRALLPETRVQASCFEFAGVCLPANTIGGDFYDWYSAGSGTGFTLGDVMGKGVGAGIIAATLRAVVRSARNEADIAVALTRASEMFDRDLASTGAFATVFHARLDESTGIVRYVDAGHGLTLHVRGDGSWRRLASSDLPVGVSATESWTAQQLLLEPGDTLISCSDGILDLYDGTIESLRHIAYIVSVSSGAANVVTRVGALINDAKLRDDDITILVLRRHQHALSPT